MYRQKLTLVFWGLFVLVMVFANCRHDGPDLVPERRSGSQGREGFCRRDGGMLTVRVRNQGNQDVVNQFKTTVVFSPGGTKSVTTAPMPAGSFTDVQVEIPAGCFGPDCNFTITVDANNDIQESIESNNTAEGKCIG